MYREAIHAYVSEEAMHAWRKFSAFNGVSLTSLIESLGLELALEMKDIEPDDLRGDWVKRARRIDAARRRRGVATDGRALGRG